jgi:glucosamine-phosphate N-acetyltransferase
MLKSIKIIDISDEFYNKYLNLLNEFRDTKFSKEFLLEFINSLPNNHDIFLMFDNENNIIGTITIIIERKLINNGNNVCHIEDLIINNLYKSNGYGSQILEFVNTYAREKKCYKIILNCNDNLKKFYEKNSFEFKNIQMGLYM